jgi:hypothetical protein
MSHPRRNHVIRPLYYLIFLEDLSPHIGTHTYVLGRLANGLGIPKHGLGLGWGRTDLRYRLGWD